MTAARYRLHPLGPVLGGMVLYPHEQAVQVLRGYRDLIATAPDELTVMAGFVRGPTGEAAVFVAPTWSGDLDAGEAAVAPLLRLGTPVAGGVGPLPYPDLIRMFEAGAQPGQHYALGTRWLPDADRRRDRGARRGAPRAGRRRRRCWRCTTSTAPPPGSPRTRPRSRCAGSTCSRR